MDPIASAAIIACGIATVVLLAWVIWTEFFRPWLRGFLDELCEDDKDGWR
jgi:hypothetical protein